jgi:hypothetical protein
MSSGPLPWWPRCGWRRGGQRSRGDLGQMARKPGVSWSLAVVQLPFQVHPLSVSPDAPRVEAWLGCGVEGWSASPCAVLLHKGSYSRSYVGASWPEYRGNYEEGYLSWFSRNCSSLPWFMQNIQCFLAVASC